MTKFPIIKTLPFAAIATAICTLTAATSFAADNKTLSWEFGDGQAHGWQIVSGEVGFYDGGHGERDLRDPRCGASDLFWPARRCSGSTAAGDWRSL